MCKYSLAFDSLDIVQSPIFAKYTKFTSKDRKSVKLPWHHNTKLMCKHMSGNSLPADEANLLRCCQKGLLDFDAGESRAPISRFQRIFNVSSSSSRHSSSRDKEIWFYPKIDFSWNFPGFSPESFGNFFLTFLDFFYISPSWSWSGYSSNQDK